MILYSYANRIAEHKEVEDEKTARLQQLLDDMKLFAVRNGLEDEFYEEIAHSPHLDAWCRKGEDVLVKRFGHFVLEHMNDIK